MTQKEKIHRYLEWIENWVLTTKIEIDLELRGDESSLGNEKILKGYLIPLKERIKAIEKLISKKKKNESRNNKI